MRLLALPENVLQDIINALQDLPFRQAYRLIGEIQNARIVVDENKNPVLVPEVTTDPAPQTEATPA